MMVFHCVNHAYKFSVDLCVYAALELRVQSALATKVCWLGYTVVGETAGWTICHLAWQSNMVLDGGPRCLQLAYL